MNNLKVKPLALAIALGLSPSALVYAQSDSSADAQLEEVIVTGVKAADLNAREAERSKDAFSSIISQDDAGNFADQNVAESLQRLPGITLQKSEGEGRYVNARGLGADFVSVTMNGSELASGGGDGRAFALDAIPADMLGSIEVYKSLTPDMDLNAIGGSVNVKTVSAFDKKRDTLKVKAQVQQQDYKGIVSPKLSISGTNLFLDDTIGVGYSFSTEKRHNVNYEVRHHDTVASRYLTVGDTTALVPFRFENRQEEGERTRNAGSLDIGFRPNDDSEYFARISHTSYQDLDVALREYYRFGQASDSEYVHLDKENRIVGAVGTDLQHQFFIQDGVALTTAFSMGGENRFNNWTLDYEIAASQGEWDKPGASRAQFRVREVPMIGAWGSNYQLGQVVTGEVMEIISGQPNLPRSANYIPDSRQQSKMEYDNIFIEDSFRTDDLGSVKFNLKKEFESGVVNYVKFGALAKSRDRTRDKNRWSVAPSDKASFGCLVAVNPEKCNDLATSTLGDFETFSPAHPDIKHDFITYDAVRDLLNETKTTATEFDKAGQDQDTVKDDYEISEDVKNIYLMAEFATSENSTLIVGGKYESTKYTSTGNVSIRFDRTEGAADEESKDVAVPLEKVENTYNDFLPSIHWRYEPRDDVLVRAALWTSFTRPNFSDSRAQVAFVDRAVVCDKNYHDVCANRTSDFNYGAAKDENGNSIFTQEEAESLNAIADTWTEDSHIKENTFVGTPNTVRIGNPSLKAQTATNFDTSITWYASDDLYLQAALFAKQIDGFIVDVRGQTKSLSQIGYSVPTDVVTANTALNLYDDTPFDDVNQAINGDVAKVYGMELTYSQYFESGLFVQSNATFISSDAKIDSSVRQDNIALPYQADQTLNLTVGWENDDFSARVITNYRSAVLEQIGACGTADIASDLARAEADMSDRVIPYECRKWADVYEDNTFGVDFKATWQATDMIDMYFDALNLTGDTSVRYFTGNEDSGGKMMYSSEDFGPSFQLGVNIKIM